MIQILIIGINLILTLLLLILKRTGLYGVDSMTELIMAILPDFISGNKRKYESMYMCAYGDRYDATQVHKVRLRNVYTFAAIWIVLSATVLIAGIQNDQSKPLPNMIERPDHGNGSETIHAILELKNGKTAVLKKVELKIKEKQLTSDEKRIILENYIKDLPKLILGENKKLNSVSQALNLPTYCKSDDITIRWTSSDPEALNEKGIVDVFQIQGQKKVNLLAQLDLDGIKIEKTFNIVLVNTENDNYRKELMDYQADSLVKKISENNLDTSIQLPDSFSNNTELKWRKGKSVSYKQILTLFVILLLITCNMKYKKIEREIKKQKESIEREFPDFISKFILLLNAGLVANTAFKKTVYDYERFNVKSNKNSLYEAFSMIDKNINNSNASLIKELQRFAARSGIKEIMRFTSIVSDNFDKGSTLADKLEREGEMIWHKQKKKAEELGRLADTKLVLPLMILLLVLIIVTITPALIIL